jgi:hypothetical protein
MLVNRLAGRLAGGERTCQTTSGTSAMAAAT